MQQEIKKQLGKQNPSRVLKRVYNLFQFLNPFRPAKIHDTNIKPIRKTVGRARDHYEDLLHLQKKVEQLEDAEDLKDYQARRSEATIPLSKVLASSKKGKKKK
ncbi:MAG: hypothetical protein Q7T03_04320 [Deltaproteobacteria bacterium]|nr:hypothetical protein [Deltaproteobacteria bacterium]